MAEAYPITEHVFDAIVVGAAVGTVLLFVKTDKAKSPSASVIRALGPGGLTLRF